MIAKISAVKRKKVRNATDLLDSSVEVLEPSGSPLESVRGDDVVHEVPVEDLDDLGGRDIRGEEGGVARDGSSVS